MKFHLKILLPFYMITFVFIMRTNIYGQDIGKPFIQRGHNSAVYSAAFSPDGKLIAGSDARTLKIWDALTGEELHSIRGHSERIRSVSFSPDGKKVVTGSYDSSLKLWDAGTGKLIRTYRGHSGGVYSVVFSPDGEKILSGSYDKTLKLWSSETGEIIRTYNGHSFGVYSVALSPDGKKILSGSEDGSIKLWSTETGEIIRTYYEYLSSVNSVAFSPDGKKILSGSSDKTLKLWDTESGVRLRTYIGHNDWVRSAAFSPDGKKILSGSNDRTLKLWDTESGDNLRTYKGLTSGVNSVAFSSDGKKILSASSDSTIKILDAITGEEILTLKNYLSDITFAGFRSEASNVVTIHNNGDVKVWDTQQGKELRFFRGIFGKNKPAALSPNGDYVVTATNEYGDLKILGIPDGKQIGTGMKNPGNIRFLFFSADAKKVASLTDKNNLKYWDIEKGTELLSVSLSGTEVNTIDISPDGKRIVTGADDGFLKVWDEKGKKLTELAGYSGKVNSVKFSPDGKFIAAGFQDKTVKLWNTLTMGVARRMRGFSDEVLSVVFTPDSKRLITISADSTMKLLDVVTGDEIFRFKSPSAAFKSVSFSSDGKKIVTTSSDRAVRIWSISSGKELVALMGGADGWLAMTPDGYFNSSGHRIEASIKFSGKLLSASERAEALKKYYRPDLVRKALTGKHQPVFVKKPRLKVQDTEPPQIIFNTSQPVSTYESTIELQGFSTDDSGVAFVFVRGKEADLDEQGNFSSKVLLKLGKNFIPVEATDIYENVTRKIYTVTRNSYPVSNTGKYKALMIAVENYTSSDGPEDLDNPVNDAKKFRKILEEKYNFVDVDIDLLENPTNAEIIETFQNLRSNIQADDSLLVFYSGHGYWDAGLKDGFWLPSDADTLKRDKWIPNSTIKNYIRAIPSKHTLLIADACFSGSIFKTKSLGIVGKTPVEELVLSKSRRAITSGMLNEVPDKSVFMEYLLKSLENNRSSQLPANKLFAELLNPVINNSPLKQIPQYGVIHGTGDEDGDFVFIRN